MSERNTTLEIVTMSKGIENLATALAIAQGQIKNPEKEADNPFFHSKYASLASIWDAIREPFSSNGLSVVQIPLCRDGKYGCITVLLHKSGEYIIGELLLPVSRDDPQGAGTAISYSRRYTLQAFAGVAGAEEEDDDGNNNSPGKEPQTTGQAAGPGPEPKPRKHTRTTPYEEVKGTGDPKVAADFARFDAFLLEHSIPPEFVMEQLRELGLLNPPHATNLAEILPGVISKCLHQKSQARLLKAWTEKQVGEAKAKVPNEKKEVPPNEGLRKPATNEDPKEYLKRQGHDDWRTVKIHFAELNGTALGKLPRKSLVWWIKTYKAKPFNGAWDNEVILLDSALVLAAQEIGME